MNFRVINNSIVVLGQEFNPALLNADFLRSTKIAKKDWDLADPPISTPVFSIVRYANGLSFSMELNKLQILDTNPPDEAESSLLPELVDKYIKKLPYVRFTAVGVNLDGIIPTSDADAILLRKFIGQGAWLANLQGIALGFTYLHGDAILRVNLEKGGALLVKDNKSIEGIVVKGNYHINIPGDVPLSVSKNKLMSVVSDFVSYRKHFNDTLVTLFGEEIV